MATDRLFYHTAQDGFAGYGRDGGQGRDILVAPSRDAESDRAMIDSMRDPQTTVVSLLDNGPSPELKSALDAMMPVWNTAKRGNIYISHDGETVSAFRRGFAESAQRDFIRQGLRAEEIASSDLDALWQDIEESLGLFDVIDPQEPVIFRAIYYPPASLPVRTFHVWHADSFPSNLMGKIRMQRSVTHDGLRFAFKEQTCADVTRGVGLSTGRAAFKITPENIHRAPKVSPTQGRLMYTVTGTPAF